MERCCWRFPVLSCCGMKAPTPPKTRIGAIRVCRRLSDEPFRYMPFLMQEIVVDAEQKPEASFVARPLRRYRSAAARESWRYRWELKAVSQSRTDACWRPKLQA